jgi:hypothetical protein
VDEKQAYPLGGFLDLVENYAHSGAIKSQDVTVVVELANGLQVVRNFVATRGPKPTSPPKPPAGPGDGVNPFGDTLPPGGGTLPDD